MDFFKYPSTPHLAILGHNTVRKDKVFTQREQTAFLEHDVIVEEKIDGANLGISFEFDGSVRAQNRSSILKLPASGQWQPLNDWFEVRFDQLFETLSGRYILFGEWCFATHSVYYDHLPDWFLGFDVYDTVTNQFIDVAGRNLMLAKMNIYPVPLIASGRFDFATVKKFLRKSQYCDEPAEGICLRQQKNEIGFGRTKLVRAEFTQAINDHWSRKPLRTNKVSLNRCPN